MSVQITIGKNQGITQAIRDRIGANEIKNSDLKTWQEVVKLVESNQSQSIFKKDNNNGTQFTTDADKINDKSSNHSNYVVDQGKVTIDGGIWAKIEKLLTGSKTENTQDEAKLKKLESPPSANLTQNPVDLNARVESKINTDNINIPVVATGKQLTRSVNGTQQKIEIQNINGQKVRFAVNDDGTRGELLVPVSTTGKNTYQTKSEFDKTVRTQLNLKEGQKLPENLKPFYVEIGGEPQLMFKSDNGTLTPKEAKAYTDSLENNSQSANTKKEIPDCTNLDAKELKKFIKANDVKEIRLDGKTYTIKGKYLIDSKGWYNTIDEEATNTKTETKHIAQGTGKNEKKSLKDMIKEAVSKIDYSKLPSEAMEEALKNNGVQLNYGGKMYTVKQGKLVDAQGNKFNIQNNKLVPVKTEQESTYTYTKRGGLNINNDNPSAFWFRGPIEFE